MRINEARYNETIKSLESVFARPYQLRAFNDPSRLKFALGNSKIGTDTMILNMGSAHNCPSARLGLCSLAHEKFGGDGSCYALKAEYMYPTSLPYRSIQKIQFELWDAEDI